MVLARVLVVHQQGSWHHFRYSHSCTGHKSHKGDTLDVALRGFRASQSFRRSQRGEVLRGDSGRPFTISGEFRDSGAAIVQFPSGSPQPSTLTAEPQEPLITAHPAHVARSKAVVMPPRLTEDEPLVNATVLAERASESGYVIKVSAELMGVFKYVEKMKRAQVKALAEALLQVAIACCFFTMIRGILYPLVEVFRTIPPNWSKLFLMLAGIDYFAVAYLAMKAREPMLQAVKLGFEDQGNIDALERQEEVFVTMIVELTKLFKRMRNVIAVLAVTQLAQLAIGDPILVANATAAAKTWLIAPWS